ncbi:MAG: lysophospholipid acyltransferase family protein [Leptospiraceae bacterium]|nr:lysophospholipid acyltransferase family protein [Leptospiraceae bacterium]
MIKHILYTQTFQKLRGLLAAKGKLPLPDLAEMVREELDLAMLLSLRDREKIPAEGRLLIVANHPLAFLDCVALYSVVSDVRKDTVAVVETLSEYIAPSPHTIIARKGHERSTVRAIHRALSEEKAVIVFPARERRWRLRRITDGPWPKAVAQMAQKWQVPVLPVFIGANNRLSHYFWTAISGMYSDMAIDAEIKSQKHHAISIKISHPIMPDALSGIKPGIAAKLLRKHVYRTGRGKPGSFRTTRNIVHPTDKREMLTEVMSAEVLGQTEDRIKILLVEAAAAPALMREIGRLREYTFRKVGEGTGKRIDLDDFDSYYQHIVLWDESRLEVVGAYRLAPGDVVYRRFGISGFYTSTLFRFSEEFEKYLPQSVELGRSFVQPSYWNSQALDYLWHGIGAYLAARPQYNYLFGPVSISNSYSAEARELLVYFYQRWFGKPNAPVRAKHRYRFSQGAEERLAQLFTSNDYKQSFKELKQNLKHYGFAVPTLYKQYTELCEEGGVHFFDFGIDKDFSNALDGFIFVSIAHVKESKLERYVYSKIPKEQWLAARAPYTNAAVGTIAPVR